MIRRIIEFLRHDLWDADFRHASGARGWLLAGLRVLAHAVRSFLGDLGGMRASALTLVTLLAVVPLLALVTGVANGLGYGEVLDAELQRLTGELPESMQPALEQVRQLVQRTSFGALGAIGSLVLAWSALQLFVQVEQAFNRTWRTTRGRSWARRVTDFLALVFLVPLLALAAMSLQSLLEGAQLFSGVEWLEALYRTWLGIVPHLLAWVAFSALYHIMPAARVRWGPAVVAGVAAGSGWLFVHQLYVSMQIGVARMNAIYATVAALPLLIAYLQVTWTIILVGAEISYAVQNRNELRGPKELPRASNAARTRLALLLAWESSRAFSTGGGGVDMRELAVELDVPVEWMGQAFEDLRRSGLFGMVADEEDRVIPLRSPHRIGMAEVIDAVRGTVPDDAEISLPAGLEERLARAESASRAALSGVHLGTPGAEEEPGRGERTSLG